PSAGHWRHAARWAAVPELAAATPQAPDRPAGPAPPGLLWPARRRSGRQTASRACRSARSGRGRALFRPTRPQDATRNAGALAAELFRRAAPIARRAAVRRAAVRRAAVRRRRAATIGANLTMQLRPE